MGIKIATDWRIAIICPIRKKGGKMHVAIIEGTPS
jgi:hypothetical protein